MPSTHAEPLRSAVELPTLLLLLACIGAWMTLTAAWSLLPFWIVAPGVAVLLTLHSSLQHEILHGHPTRWRALNEALGNIPLSLWLPFARYRDTHLAHHVNHRLTDPLRDPESNYWRRDDLAGLPAWQRVIVRVESTLAGRVLLGPWWRIPRFLLAEWRALRRGEPGVRAAWMSHAIACVPVLLWVGPVCGIPPWVYVFGMVMPGYGILLIRSFAEHRAEASVPERTAIVEDAWVLGPLFLFNNLHALHHEDPALPWYRYLPRYRAERLQLIARNGGLVYAGYAELARRYLFRPHDALVHPGFGAAPADPGPEP